jgi:hypothetical protein
MGNAVFRFTIIDPAGTVSFLGPGHGPKVFAAACSQGAEDHRGLLRLAESYDAHWIAEVRAGLHVFDEHNVSALATSFQDHVRSTPGDRLMPFRVIDTVTRRLSTQSARSGLILFNLNQKRIIQVQNSYSELREQDRGRIRADGHPTSSFFFYRLPETWRILP